MDFLSELFSYSPEEPLFFTRPYFWGFLAVLLLLYSFFYREQRLRNSYLLLMSLFFYYKSGGFFFLLLIFSTIVDFFIGKGIGSAKTKSIKKILVALSIFVNIGILAYFKYTFFFIDLLQEYLNLEIAKIDYLSMLSNQWLNTNFDLESIFLPIGISFFTFQTISYSVDVYRGKLEPVKNILDFGFYVSFFPQLVAGPIVRAAQFIPQIYQKYHLTKQQFGHALFLILSGLVKKMVISDYISINFVDRVFESPLAFSGFENLMALYGYSLQIYCDFSGYTDIAIGVALWLGFRLPVNFNSPYKATSITDFWHRWHISLSSWLRDYLYIPLGGNRKGKIRRHINIMITMLLGGLWHGASLNFILWGGLHGVGLIIHKIWHRIIPTPRKRSFRLLRHFLTVLLTFHFITFAWIFFRSENFNKGMMMIHQIFSDFGWNYLLDMILGYRLFFVLIIWGFALHWLPEQFKEMFRGFFINWPLIFKILFAIFLVFFIYQFQTAELQPFIYFQF